MKINSKHRVLSIILSVLMVLSLMPVAVFADDGTTSNYVTLELTFGENVASEDVEAAKSIYQNVRYADCSKANEAYMSLYGITWEKGYLDVTDNNAPLRKYAGVSGSVTEVKYLVNGSVAGFTSLQSNGNNIDSTIGGNHQMFRTSYSVVGIDDVNGNKAEITSGNIQAYVAGGYDSSFTESGKLTVDNIAFTSTTSTTMAASAAIATAGSSKKAVSAEMEIKNCTFSGRVYVYDNFENYGVMTYNIHDNVFDGTNYSGDSNAYAIFAQCRGGNNLIIKNNKISGFARGINIDHENINAVIEGNDITITDAGRSCIQLSSLESASISSNNIILTGGNAYTLHEKLLNMSKTPVIRISGDKITGNGYLIYDDAVANSKQFTTENLSLTFDNVEIADTVNTTKGVKGEIEYENSPVVKEAVSGASSAVATIGGVGYASLAEAIAAAKDGDTVKLLSDCSGNGIQVETNKFANEGLTVDFDGHTYTVGGVLVGSAGTGTNAFQLLAGNNIVFMNGTIAGVTENTKPAEDTPNWHGAPAIVIQNYANLTLKNMSVVGGDETVYTVSNNNGDVVIEDTVITAGKAKGYTSAPVAFDVCRYADYPSVTVTVKGNSIINGDIEVSGNIGDGQSRQLNIENGTFNGEFKVANTPANIAVSGGKFSTEIPEDYCADGFIPTKNADGTYTVKSGSYVAKVGSAKYETLAEAFAAAQSGDTVALLADVTEDVVISENITLDLGGKTLTNTSAGKATISVQNGATVTVTNGNVVGGTSYYNIEVVKGSNANLTLTGVTATAGNTGSSMIDSWGNLTIKSGTYTGGLNVVKSEEGSTLVITGGEFTLNYSKKWAYNAVILVYGDTTISGGTFIQSLKTASGYPQVVMTGVVDGYTAITKITGGTYINNKSTKDNIFHGLGKATSANFEVSGGSFNKTISDGYCSDGFIPTKNADGTYGVKEGKYVAAVGSTKYETLADAIRLAAAGKTITLLDDISLSSTVTINKKVTIDLNQKTLTGTDKYILNIGANGNVTIMNGTINVSDSGSAITAYGTLALDDVDITGKATDYSLLYVNQKANVTIDKDTTITATDATSSAPYPAIFISGQDSDGNTYDPTLNIYGTVSAAKAPAIQGNGTDRGTSHINIYDGALIKSNKLAIYLPQICDVNITGGTVTGYCGIGIKSGTLNISGGTVQGVANDNDIGDQYSQTNGISYDGSAILIDSYIGYAGNVTINISDNAKIESLHSTAIREIGNDKSQTNMVALNITGGEITGADGSDAVLVRETTAPTVAISGGSFSSAVKEEYCADGFIPTLNEDGTYGVKVGTYIAETNGVKYESLEEAINAAKSGATVTMLADTDANITVTKKITLDLNGFTINGKQVKGKATIKVDNTTLTVEDSSEAKTGTIMREDTAENSGVSSYYVIDIQGKYGFLKFTGGNVKNGSGVVGVKGSSLVRLGDDNVRDANPTLTITGGTFTQDNFVAIKVDYGTLHLLGGVVNSANSYAVENWRTANIKGGTVNGTVSSWAYSTGVPYSTLTISGGTVNGDVASVNYDSAVGKQARIYVKGGTVTGTLGTYTYANGLVPTDETAMATIEITAGTFEKNPTKYVVEGSAVKTNDDGTFGVEKLLLAKVGDTSYYTWDEAYKAQTKSGEPIVLLRNYTTDKVLNSGSINRTIDLNGFTYKYTGKDTDCAAFEVNYANVTLTVINGTVESTQLMGLIPTAMSGTITYDNSGIIFDGVKMTAYGHAGIETNGSNENCTITLKNSELNVPNGYGINFASSGTLTIDNSVINAKTMGVQICAGSLNIVGDGTKITVAGDGVEKTENDGAIEDGAAISIVDRTGYKGLESIKIEAGTFIAKDGNDALKAYKWENKTESAFDNANDTVAVSGGTFSTEVKKDYCVDGYKSVTDSNGNYTVKEANITVKVSSNISAAGTLTGGDMYAKGETVTVTAAVNPGYVFLGWYDASGKLVNANTTYTFEAAENVDLIATFKGNKNVKLSVGLSGGIVTVSGDVTAKWRNDVKDNEFLLGTSFVLTAAPRAGYTFLYWINSEGRILSDEPEYKFTLGMDTSIKACFMETEQWEDSSYVIFRDNITKKIIWSGDVEMTAHSDGIYGTVAAPALLNYSGVTFTGWRDADGNVVTPDENGNIRITSNITIYAIYQATSDTFDVTVDGETVGSYGFRTSVSVTAPETKDGKYFAGWYRDGVLVSTNANYSFIIRSATALTTKYTGIKQEPASVAILTVGDREQKADGDVVAPFSLDWSLAEGCELVKVGIIRTYDASLKDKLTLENVNGSTIKTKESVLTTSDGNYQFNLTMGSTAAANDVYMTGYVMYRAANGNIITLYTDVVTSPAGN